MLCFRVIILPSTVSKSAILKISFIVDATKISNPLFYVCSLIKQGKEVNCRSQSGVCRCTFLLQLRMYQDLIHKAYIMEVWHHILRQRKCAD